MIRITITLIVTILLFSIKLRADEGMWIPLLLKKYNIEEMQKKGFKLTAEDIYNVNKACMKDAVMIFGRGCTAELISNEGLIITNHHCGYGAIQSHSTLEHDYLTDGFWAMKRKDELTNPNLTVTFLVRMEDVTDKVLKGVTDEMDSKERSTIIQVNAHKIEAEAIKETHYKAKIKPFFSGNEYYLFVTEVFKDVRLVGTPPSAIGKFGGDTDNWMWPRHTGDFSLFRIYADKDNNPAEFSEDNVPYKPKKFFPISMKGVKKGDFTMVFGYPGHTSEYMPSYGVKLLMETINPDRIAIRQTKIDVMAADMNADAGVRIKYSAKYAGVSNAWKKWIGQNRGLKRLDAIEKKQMLEKDFQSWAQSDKQRNEKYGNILPRYKELYEKITPYDLARQYLFEAGLGLDLIEFAGNLNKLSEMDKETKQETVDSQIERIKTRSETFYKDYNKSTEKKLFKEIISIYFNEIDKEYQPTEFNVIREKFGSDISKYTEFVFKKSMLVDKDELFAFLNKYNIKQSKKIKKDPLFTLYKSIIDLYYNKIYAEYNKYSSEIEKLDRIYMKALREFQSDKVFYPDANFTLRVAYGQVDDYYPRDGVHYVYYTTLDGIIEKDNPDIYDYRVPEKLKELHRNKDYGKYAEDGEMHVCFTASNHTTGGNSGSPVINGDGHLIGVNFDRNWEGTMSDIMYDQDQCRNISLDIRYALFIIDKFAGAKHLIDEMKLIY